MERLRSLLINQEVKTKTMERLKRLKDEPVNIWKFIIKMKKVEGLMFIMIFTFMGEGDHDKLNVLNILRGATC